MPLQPDGGPRSSTPPLVACVLNSRAYNLDGGEGPGSVGVFPGDETVCSRLGMANADID
ncbi:hypothetical protein [Actinokineospora cianjurensis]|uniref:hypothetical protein n=1 Tax=Actinokineospora cianjurensis TaxID=585224 RepID=UPI001476EE5B|nr:hypothetical protein [Actinokineospora cianjurensis]